MTPVKVPLIVGVVARLSFTTVIAFALLKISLWVVKTPGPPRATVGVVVPPFPLKFSAARVLT